MELTKDTKLKYTPDTDTSLQVKGKTKVYFTKDDTQEKLEWQILRLDDRVIIPAQQTYYFWCSNDNILAEIEV